jgi:hypothetical protein
MSTRVTLEELERLVAQLPPSDRLKLVAQVCEQLSTTAAVEGGAEAARRARLARVDAWLAESDAVADSIEGDFDSAAEIRQAREERANAG